jgi:glycosyltransferase involved in cell wall biosynthesis
VSRLRLAALLTVRNEEHCLARCLRHLNEQGVETTVIDNGSEDGTRAIAQSFLGRGVARVEALRFRGTFELKRILENEERLAKEIAADWFIHHDADEIRQTPDGSTTLLEAIARVDEQGYNAVNFDEFVFLPTAEDGSFVGRDYVAEMRYYYFFAPTPRRRITAWKKTGAPISLAASAGHRVAFAGRRLYPEPFILRHYVALSREHLVAKYSGRRYSGEEIATLGWHRSRAAFAAERLSLPPRSMLHRLEEGEGWVRSAPRRQHLFLARPGSCVGKGFGSEG